MPVQGKKIGHGTRMLLLPISFSCIIRYQRKDAKSPRRKGERKMRRDSYRPFVNEVHAQGRKYFLRKQVNKPKPYNFFAFLKNISFPGSMLRKKGDPSCSSRVFASLRLCVELLNTHQSVNICKSHSSLWKKYLWVIARAHGHERLRFSVLLISFVPVPLPDPPFDFVQCSRIFFQCLGIF